MCRYILLALSHGAFAAAGFAAGIYLLPILSAPQAPSSMEVKRSAGQARFTAEFIPDLKGSDLLHWGEGTLSVGARFISLQGKIAPGPDYRKL